MCNTETWPTNDISITNVLVPVDPFLETEIFATWILVDVDVGWEDFGLVVWRDKHLQNVSGMHSAGEAECTYIVTGKGSSIVY